MQEQEIDVLIIGAGPAGLQAGLHAVRKKASVLIVGRAERSSIYSAHVENYLCVEGVVDGAELLRIAREQVVGFGAGLLAEDILHIEQRDRVFAVRTESRELSARSIIIATGTARTKLKVKGEKELTGRGVSYCVDCDANFFRNVKVAVVGDGSAAVDGALTLTGYASDVTLVTHGLEVSGELVDKLAASPVKLITDNWVREIAGEQAVSGIFLEDDGHLEVEGVFIELGSKGAMELAVNLGVQLDSESFTHIEVNRRQETNVAGIFAAGDITGHPYQMAKAVGEGCVAGLNAANYARRVRKIQDSE